MTPIFIIGVLRAIVELAGLCLIGQAILYVLAGQGRAANPIYQLFQLLCKPMYSLLRPLTTPWLSERKLPLLAFCVLFILWLGLAYLRHHLCLQPDAACRL